MHRKSLATIIPNAGLVLLFAIAVSHAAEPRTVMQEQPKGIIRLLIEGTLGPDQQLPCIAVSDASDAYTPSDLHTTVAQCIEQAEFNEAARLFMFAGVYARCDSEQILEKTAKSSSQVLILNTFAKVSKEQKDTFVAAFNAPGKTPSELQALCADLSRLGPPTYFPKNLMLHDVDTWCSPKPLENALDA